MYWICFLAKHFAGWVKAQPGAARHGAPSGAHVSHVLLVMSRARWGAGSLAGANTPLLPAAVRPHHPRDCPSATVPAALGGPAKPDGCFPRSAPSLHSHGWGHTSLPCTVLVTWLWAQSSV